jgi:hypothetical protein
MFDEFLTPERGAPPAAIAAAQEYLGLIQEFHCRSYRAKALKLKGLSP